MIAVALMRDAPKHAVPYRIAMGEAVQGVAAMAEGHHRGRRDKAKCGERRGGNRYAEPKPGAELLQHG